MTSASARTPPWQSETLTDVLSIQLYIPIGHASGDSLGQNSGSQLYSPEERKRRDSSVWTLVQGVLAPLQFLIFLVSLVLVVRYLATGEGYLPATASIVIKTFALYAIMITGSIWEKVVFGRYLFAPAFFWEDVFSMLVLALHTAYLAALYLDALAPRELMVLALAAYAAYVVNAAQFLLKLRAARRDSAGRVQQTSEMIGHVQ
ncbi:MAG: 2-vinyl bacteriochlorophyllide hydratase [Pseudorhodoplanes sp.]|nr:2-vinyl bacteriochlorophyllide hydratase [Pseudorhodoplanes sp.]